MTNHLQLAFGGLGPWEIILILAVVLVLFGAKKSLFNAFYQKKVPFGGDKLFLNRDE